MNDKLLICTVGLPRSGKSTWAQAQPYPIVNPDSIRLALHGQRYYAPAEPLVWYTAKIMVMSLFTAGHDRVIVDATNTTRKRRDEWSSPLWGTVFKLMDTPDEVCLQRATGDPEIFPVIERMIKQREVLRDDEEVINWSVRRLPRQ